MRQTMRHGGDNKRKTPDVELFSDRCGDGDTCVGSYEHVGQVLHGQKHLSLYIWDLYPFQCPIESRVHVYLRTGCCKTCVCVCGCVCTCVCVLTKTEVVPNGWNDLGECEEEDCGRYFCKEKHTVTNSVKCHMSFGSLENWTITSGQSFSPWMQNKAMCLCSTAHMLSALCNNIQ